MITFWIDKYLSAVWEVKFQTAFVAVRNIDTQRRAVKFLRFRDIVYRKTAERACKKSFLCFLSNCLCHCYSPMSLLLTTAVAYQDTIKGKSYTIYLSS